VGAARRRRDDGSGNLIKSEFSIDGNTRLTTRLDECRIGRFIHSGLPETFQQRGRARRRADDGAVQTLRYESDMPIVEGSGFFGLPGVESAGCGLAATSSSGLVGMTTVLECKTKMI